jgi:hypothetical protein
MGLLTIKKDVAAIFRTPASVEAGVPAAKGSIYNKVKIRKK